MTYVSDPAAEARARIGADWSTGGVDDTVLADAERQLTAMLTGLNDLLAAFPMLGAPDDRSAGATAEARSGRASETGWTAAQTGRAAASTNLHALSISELAQRLHSRKLSPVEVTRALLDRIERHDGTLKTYILVTADEALKAAQQAEEEIGRGDYRGPLHGVPLAAKDLYDAAGLPTTAGSKILKGWVPSQDSAAVAAWREAGAVLLGKNTLHEFAFGGTSVNAHTGTPRNPWDTSRMCAGSSGGSAAAVVAGLAYGAFGSETGNSIRRPASFCGVVGLKPTYGRCSRRGVFPLAWSLDHVGVFARTASDVALLTEPLGGYDAADPGSRRAPEGAGSLAPLGELRGKRVGVPRALLDEIDPEVMAAFEAALGALRREGVEVRDVELPVTSRWTALASSITMQAEAAAVHAGWLRERPTEYGADVLGRLVAGSLFRAPEYARAQAIRGAVRDELDAALRELDAFAAPTTPTPAVPLEGGALVAGDAPFGTAVSAFHLQRIWSLTGLPAVAAPIGL
ncbi:MAG TPA: amidase, partial [Chloroflexota bacterium]|nr:amidase [Chloroflexota bacterium]